MTTDSFLIVGLGNPGRQFRDSRHNVGFMLVERMAEQAMAAQWRAQARALVTSIALDDHKVLLAKPQTYMNLSGQSVHGLVNFYKLPLEKLLVAHDDLDLPFGTLRLRPAGGPGGQKGMASAIDYLGTREFPRLRIGIGRPPGRMDPAAYVLQSFTRDELESLPEVLGRASDSVGAFVRHGLDRAMNLFNADIRSE